MDFMTKKIFFLLLVCWISFEGDAETFVPEVETLPSVFLEEGVEGKLTCGYDRNVYAVYWRYKSATSQMKLLIVMDRYYQVGEKSGPGYEEGRFDMTDEYSLIIHNVSAKDEGRYMCEVSDITSGDAFRNFTDVTTIVKAERPFPRIEQCEDGAPCFLHTISDDPRIELTCRVLGAKPMAILSWTSSLSSERWKQAVNVSTLTKKERRDGIFDQILSVTVDTSYFTSDIEYFTCVAEGLSVDGIANQTIEISFTIDHVVDEGVNVTVIAVTSSGCILLLIVLIGILWKIITRRRNGGNRHSPEMPETKYHELEGENSQLTKEDCEPIGDNSQSTKADFEPVERKRLELEGEINRGNPKPIYFGIFGSTEAGKSALIDSLIFAFTGRNHKEIPEEIPPYRDTAWRMSIRKPSKIIALCDMKDMDIKKLDQFLKRMNEDEGYMSKRDVIHYPIIVSDTGKHKKDSSYEESLARFSEAVMKSISKYPILVLTHKNPSEIPDRERIISRLSLKTDIPVDNIFVTASKRVDDTTKEDEILQLLELLLKCLRNVTGGNHMEIPEEIPTYRDTAWRMSIKRPSKFIALCEMKDMDLKKLEQSLKPINTDEGYMSKGDAFHYPIIVNDIGKNVKDEESLPPFSEVVMTSISKHPVLLLTCINPSKIPDRETIISRLSSETDIPFDNIFLTGTKEVGDTTKEDEILQLLEILLKCVKNVTVETAA